MKKGFTLIELLAVIVILAIIAVIAVPIVLNIIDDSKKNATLRSADFYLEAVEMSVAQATLKDKTIKDGTYNILESGNICIGSLNRYGVCVGIDKDGKIRENHEEDILEVEVNGEVPKSGTITITNGNISNVSIVLNDKTIIKNNNGELEFFQSICKAATTSKVGTVPTGNYIPGEEYSCEVADGDYRTFYVLSTNIGTDGSVESVNLIMNNNISPTGQPSTNADDILEWINSDDYVSAGGQSISEITGVTIGYDKGPITVMNYIDSATTTRWTKVPALQASVETANKTTKARLPREEELTAVGCMTFSWNSEHMESCPAWIMENLSIYSDKYIDVVTSGPHWAYWAYDTSNLDLPTDGFYEWSAPSVVSDGYIDWISPAAEPDESFYRGIRPVITISTSDIQ